MGLDLRQDEPGGRPAADRVLERRHGRERRRTDRRQLDRRQLERRDADLDRAADLPPLPRSRRRIAASLLQDVRHRMADDHVVIVAAGVAFSFFLSIFPTLFAAVSIYGLVADTQTIESHLAWLSGLLPPIALELVRGQLHAIAAAPRTALQWGTALSVLLALWSAAGGALALIEGLNIAYDVEEKRGFFRVRATALALSLGFVVFLLVSATLIAAVPNVISRVPLADSLRIAGQVGQWAVLVALILVVLRVLYGYAPARSGAAGRWITAGAVTGAVLWLAASALFSWYAANFGRFDKTHGALGAVVALLLWLQISAVVVLLGAELDAAIERRRAAQLA